MIALSESQLISRPRPVRRHRCHWKLVAKKSLRSPRQNTFLLIELLSRESRDHRSFNRPALSESGQYVTLALYTIFEVYAFDLKWPISQRYPTTTQLP
jgi:hypothetical protein